MQINCNNKYHFYGNVANAQLVCRIDKLCWSSAPESKLVINSRKYCKMEFTLFEDVMFIVIKFTVFIIKLLNFIINYLLINVITLPNTLRLSALICRLLFVLRSAANAVWTLLARALSVIVSAISARKLMEAIAITEPLLKN